MLIRNGPVIWVEGQEARIVPTKQGRYATRDGVFKTDNSTGIGERKGTHV